VRVRVGILLFNKLILTLKRLDPFSNFGIFLLLSLDRNIIYSNYFHELGW